MTKETKASLKITTPDRGLEYDKARGNFLSEAEKKPSHKTERAGEKKEKTCLPWGKPEVSERVLKSFNLRLSEPDFLKLKFIASKSSDKSMHAFCTRIIMEEVERKLEKSPG